MVCDIKYRTYFYLTHGRRENMTSILHLTVCYCICSNVMCCILTPIPSFLRVQITTSKHWLRYCVENTTSHYDGKCRIMYKYNQYVFSACTYTLMVLFVGLWTYNWRKYQPVSSDGNWVTLFWMVNYLRPADDYEWMRCLKQAAWQLIII